MTFQEMQKNKIKSQLKTGNKANTDLKLSQLILFKKILYMHITTNSSAAFFHNYKIKIFGII